MANVYQVLGNHDKALQLYQLALDIKINTLGERHISVASTHFRLSSLWKELTQPQFAIAYASQATNIIQSTRQSIEELDTELCWVLRLCSNNGSRTT